MKKMLREAAVLSAGSLGAYGYGIARYGQGPTAGTMAFLSLTVGQLLHALTCRSENRTIFTGERQAPNRYLTAAMLGTFALQGVAIAVPGLRRLLGIARLSLVDGLVAGGGAVLPLIVNEGDKKAQGRRLVNKHFVFTSESVTEGHPDKLCDQISDAFVDRILQRDPYARVVAECAISNAIVFIAARFDTPASVDFPYIAREVIDQIGYTHSQFNSKTCSVVTSLQEMAADAYSRFDEKALTDEEIDRVVARNQVTVFGFACTQTPAFMPLPIWLAHKLSRRLTSVRLQKTLPDIGPDGWTQVSVEYEDRKPSRIHGITVIASTTRNEVTLKNLHDMLMEEVIMPVFFGRDLQARREDAHIHKPRRPFLWRRAFRPQRADGQEERHRHLRRVLAPQRRGLKRQGPAADRPLGGLCRAVRSEERGGSRVGGGMRGHPELLYRACAAGEHTGGDLRHRQADGRRDRGPRRAAMSISVRPPSSGSSTSATSPRSSRAASTAAWPLTAK